MRGLINSILLLFIAVTLTSQNLIVDGSVGIWTSSVGKSLEVYGNILTKSSPVGGYATSMAAGSDGVTSFWMNNNYNPANHTSGWSRVLNFKNGMVGIGTTDPLYHLHVKTGNDIAIYGDSNTRVGVQGVSSSNAGVTGYSYTSVGVHGKSRDDIGVYGTGALGSSDFWAHRGNYGGDSSIRWKRNVVNIPDPLDILSKLRGVYFNWDKEHGGSHAVGFIAEEVGEVLPEVVFYEENGIDAKGMDYSKMTPLLVEAANAMRAEYQEKFKRQEEINETQSAEIQTLKEELALIKELLRGTSVSTSDQ